MTKQQSEELNTIIEELLKEMPEESVTTSSITRYTLQKYVREHIAKRYGTKIFIEVSTADVTEIISSADKLARYAGIAPTFFRAVRAVTKKANKEIECCIPSFTIQPCKIILHKTFSVFTTSLEPHTAIKTHFKKQYKASGILLFKFLTKMKSEECTNRNRPDEANKGWIIHSGGKMLKLVKEIFSPKLKLINVQVIIY